MTPTVLTCPSCARKYRPHPYDPAQAYTCRQCDGPLALESTATAPSAEPAPRPSSASAALPAAEGRRPRAKARARVRRAPFLAASTALLVAATSAWVVVGAVRARNAAIGAANRAEKARGEAEGSAYESGRRAEAAARDRDAVSRRLAEALVLQGDLLGKTGRWGEAHDVAYREAQKIHGEVAEPGFSRVVRHQPPPLIAFAGHSTRVDALAFCPERGRVASGSADGTVAIWDVLTGRRLLRLEQGSGVTALAFSPDGRRLGSASADGKVRMWEDGRERWGVAASGAAVRSLAFSWDGERVLSAGADGTIRLTCAETGDRVREWGVEEDVSHAAFLPQEGAVFYGASDGGCRLLDFETGEIRRVAEGGAGRRTPVPFALAPYRPAALSGARGIDLESGQEFVDHPAHAAATIAVAVSPDERLAVSLDGSREVKVWELRHGRDVRSYDWHAAGASCAAFSPDGRWIASGGNDGTLHLWEVAVGTIDPGRFQEIRSRAVLAQARLADSPDDEVALRHLSDWWRFRGFGEAALELVPEGASSSARAPRR